MAKKVYNFNSIRPAIVAAHNSDNRKVISKEVCDALNIDNEYLVQWHADVKALQGVVEAWVDLSWNGKFDSAITEEQITEAKERVFPKWKEILSCAEEKKDKKSLKVSEFDVDALFKFCWDFKATGVGSALGHATNKQFLLKVETLVGCIIAEKAMLTDKERDVLETYNKAIKTIQGCEESFAENEASRKNYNIMLSQIPETEAGFIRFIKNKINELDELDKTVSERKVNAESELAKVKAEAQQIRTKIKYSGK